MVSTTTSAKEAAVSPYLTCSGNIGHMLGTALYAAPWRSQLHPQRSCWKGRQWESLSSHSLCQNGIARTRSVGTLEGS